MLFQKVLSSMSSERKVFKVVLFLINKCWSGLSDTLYGVVHMLIKAIYCSTVHTVLEDDLAL